MLRLSGLFDRTATAGCLAALREEPVIPGLTDALVGMKPTQWNSLLGKLERAHLLKLKFEPDRRQAVDAHPLIREYFAKQLREKQPEAFRAAHSRLFDHLCRTTPHRPDTLDGLQPLYQAVVHGCRAGRHQEACDQVFFNRIRRGDDAYSWKVLGAMGADLATAAAFFDEPWSHLSSTLRVSDRAWLLNEAAFSLRHLGRLSEAEQPLRTCVEMRIQEENWTEVAVSLGNLSEVEMTLGRLADAVQTGQKQIEHADLSGDEHLQVISVGSVGV